MRAARLARCGIAVGLAVAAAVLVRSDILAGRATTQDLGGAERFLAT